LSIIWGPRPAKILAFLKQYVNFLLLVSDILLAKIL